MIERKLKIPYLGMTWKNIPFEVEDPDGDWWLLLADESSFTLFPRALLKIYSQTSFDTIWEKCLDMAKTVPEKDLYQAFGFDTDEDYQEAFSKLDVENYEYLDLAEGYHFQPNFSGTGIVELGAMWRLERYDHKKQKELLK